MKKIYSKGFMLVEALVVTAFVAGVLLFLFVQFSKLSNSYNEYYIYNTVEGMYSLEDIKNYAENDTAFMSYIESNLTDSNHINISDCSLFTDKNYCLTLFELLNIDSVYVLSNNRSYKNIVIDSPDFSKFIERINNKGTEPYRIIGSFNNGTFATIRFGE